MKRAVFLDRDGVVNLSLVREGRPYAPRTIEEFKISPEIHELKRLKDLGYLLIIATNQPDVAHGLISPSFLDDAHGQLREAFPFDDIFVCPHSNKDNCECRKPKPGMIQDARDKFDIDLAQSYLIGDRWRDVLAGQAAGCSTVFLDYGYREETPEFHPNFVCDTLTEAIIWIESQPRNASR
jgi:D-glycero-D-manno-heptose 1,7-bisphosphate phosphatase